MSSIRNSGVVDRLFDLTGKKCQCPVGLAGKNVLNLKGGDAKPVNFAAVRLLQGDLGVNLLHSTLVIVKTGVHIRHVTTRRGQEKKKRGSAPRFSVFR